MEGWSLFFRALLAYFIVYAAMKLMGKREIGKRSVSEPERGGEKSAAGGRAVFKLAELPLPLIMDGKVQDENLLKIGQTRFWLKNQLQPQGVSDFKHVFFCSIDHRGKLFVDKKK